MSSDDHGPSLPDLPAESGPVRWASRLASLIWWLLLGILLLFALYAGIGRQLTSNIDSFRDDLAHQLSIRTGKQVTIGALSARWNWLDPTFLAQDISVAEPQSGETVARLQHLRIRPSFLASLLRARLVFEEFEADGLDLTLTQAPSGNVSVKGVQLPAPAQTRLQDLLGLAGEWLSDPYVKLTRLHLRIRDNSDNVRYLDIPQLDLVYSRGLFRASGRAMRAGTTEQLASFSLVGRQFFRGDFTGQLYLDVTSGRLFDSFAEAYDWRGIRIEGFDLGGRAWLTFRDGLLEQVSGSVQTPYLQLGTGQQSLAPIEDIRAHFGWRRTSGGPGNQEPGSGEWHIRDLQWRWDKTSVPPFSVRVMPKKGADLDLVADSLPLEPLRRLFTALPLLPGAADRALNHYKPSGALDKVHLSLPGSGGFAMAGHLNNVAVDAYGGAPGASGLYGQIALDAASGFVQLEPGHGPVTLGFPMLFGDDWSLSDMQGTVAWQLSDETTRVFSHNIRMRYGDRTQLTGAFDLRLEKDGEDNLGLRVGVENGQASMLADFVPVKAVDPGLYEWLTTSITKADITSGVYYGHGPIGRNAPHGAFVSSMWYEFDNASVRYDERWPAVTGARGRVEVHNGKTDVRLTAGETGGLSLSPSHVQVLPAEGGSTIQVDASTEVPGEAIRFWLDKTPLGEMAGSAANGLVYGGRFGLDLGLSIPLAPDRPTEVTARVRTDNGSVSYPDANLIWKDIQGDVTYRTKDGFSGAPIKATFFGEPVTVSLRLGDGNNRLGIRQSGRLEVPRVFRQAGLEALDGLGVTGKLNYVADLSVDAETTSGIRVTSSLDGLKVNWPEPLAKAASEKTPLTVNIDPTAKDGVRVRGTWQDRADFDVLWKKTGFDLTFGSLHLGQSVLKDIDISSLTLSDRWVVTTESDRATGRVVIPKNDDPVKADFEKVRLARDDSTSGTEPDSLPLDEQLKAFRSLNMGRWPDVDVSIAKLQVNDNTLGSWSFQLRPEPYRLKVNSIQGRLDSLTLLGDLTWSIVSDRQVSRFDGSVTGGALADLQKLFGADIPLTNKKTDIELDVDWPGRPDAFSLRKLSGSVRLRLDDGIILQKNNTAQVFRIFNLLNADTLWRRLKLDFSDLYERGVAFDAISGKAQIINGLVTLDPELQIVGPSGAFKLSGTTDLDAETLDMGLVVVLPLTQNLPLAALLMGAAAPVGGALFVLDKVLGDPLSKLTSASYSVTGTWSDPKVELRRVFDNGK